MRIDGMSESVKDHVRPVHLDVVVKNMEKTTF